MALTMQPVLVATGAEEDGVLVFSGDSKLLAVLVKLSDENEIAPGQWYLEASFGGLPDRNAPTFASLDEAALWIDRHGESRPFT